jgi:hypothetical protein
MALQRGKALSLNVGREDEGSMVNQTICPATERYLGCKQNLGYPVNDLFDLGTAEQIDQTNFQSAAVKPSTPLEIASQGVECRHGGYWDRQIATASPGQPRQKEAGRT